MRSSALNFLATCSAARAFRIASSYRRLSSFSARPPGDGGGRGSTTGEGRAATPSPGSASRCPHPRWTAAPRRWHPGASLSWASACRCPYDEAFSPVVRHAHRARTGDVSRTDHPVEEAILHRMVQAAGRIPVRDFESRVPEGQLQRCRVGGALHGMPTRKKASQGGPFPPLLQM